MRVKFIGEPGSLLFTETFCGLEAAVRNNHHNGRNWPVAESYCYIRSGSKILVGEVDLKTGDFKGDFEFPFPEGEQNSMRDYVEEDNALGEKFFKAWRRASVSHFLEVVRKAIRRDKRGRGRGDSSQLYYLLLQGGNVEAAVLEAGFPPIDE